MPPRKAAAKNSKTSSANGSDQEAKTKKAINKRSSKVEIENMGELPPKKKSKIHHHRKQGEWALPSSASWEVYCLTLPADSTSNGGVHEGSKGAVRDFTEMAACGAILSLG